MNNYIIQLKEKTKQRDALFLSGFNVVSWKKPSFTTSYRPECAKQMSLEQCARLLVKFGGDPLFKSAKVIELGESK